MVIQYIPIQPEDARLRLHLSRNDELDEVNLISSEVFKKVDWV
jgi:hypothetical protein